MVHFVDGQKLEGHANQNSKEYKRAPTQFRNHVSLDADSKYQPEPNRYVLYMTFSCPWASGTDVMRRLKKLEGAIDLAVLHPERSDDNGWHFEKTDEYPGTTDDPVYGAQYLYEIYTKSTENRA
eukprot:GFYU01021800.1.p1 GENE.GFYU01021800.1~~GFYU01021800.1.p1  ORF type:complete len:124 (-),score=26.82 GFYU01021800.1:5-376(-)